MTLDGNRALKLLIDRAEIQDLIMRYARGVDRRDLDLVADCFTADASYEGTLAVGSIQDALAALAKTLPSFESTMHFMGNQIIDLKQDKARSETYAIAYHRRKEGSSRSVDLTVAVRYLDELIRCNGRWFIRRRVVEPVWRREDALVPPPA
jgi:hypothetical protein